MKTSGHQPGARETALQGLQIWEDGRMLCDSILEREIRSKLSGSDADLAAEIFLGSIRWRARFEFVLDQSSFKVKEKSLRLLLHSALYQLLFLQRVPAYAVVDEAVTLAPMRSKKLVNAFLRGFLREKEDWESRIAACESTHPEVYFSQPRWLIDRWDRHLGHVNTRRLLAWNNTVAPVFIRVNTLKSSVETLSGRLRDHDPRPTAHPLALQIGSPAGLFNHPAFLEGAFYAQDPGTLAACELLEPRPGETVWDACAAPGGKTTYLAQLMNNSGRILATDADASRLRKVDENRRRLGCSIIETVAPALAKKIPECVDRILLDVPCSNTGVLRRRVDLRWKIRQDQIQVLAQRQLELCLHHVDGLRPGGSLVYSTCSLEPEENEQVVEQLLKSRPGLRREATWSGLPPESGMDGGFAVRLKKPETR